MNKILGVLFINDDILQSFYLQVVDEFSCKLS